MKKLFTLFKLFKLELSMFLARFQPSVNSRVAEVANENGWRNICCIPEPVWAVGFALEQSLHVVALACSAFRILKRLQYNFIFIVTIISATVILTGCQSLRQTDNSPHYLGQNPSPAPSIESLSRISTTDNAPNNAPLLGTIPTATAANPVVTPNLTQPISPTLNTQSNTQFVDVPLADPFGAPSQILPAQNQAVNKLPESNFSPNYQPPNHTPDNGLVTDYKKPQHSPPPIPQPSPFDSTQKIAAGNIVTGEHLNIWGDASMKSQSINEAAKNENDNLEKNRLLEIARSKQQQDVDPKKKYLRSFSDRLGPFADNKDREDIERSIISPVAYLEENPKIYDNKPIFDWEKEEQAAFDWSVIDPVILFNKCKDKLGFGLDESKAKQHMQEGRDILLKVKQKSEVTVPAQLSQKEQLAQEKLYKEAGIKFTKAAKRLPDSILKEDALYLAGESFFFSGNYQRAFNAYQELMIKYKHSKYLDTTARRLFAIARYWEAVDDKNKITLVNFTEKTRPTFDTFGYAGKAYETIFINDPNNPLSDDAVMAIASAHLARGKYEGDISYEKAAFYYKYLTENYPLSEHFDKARKGELLARSEAYMGAEYNDKTLNDAQELAEMITRSRTPNQIPNDENDAITELNENIITKNAEREWVTGQYYDKKGFYGSAKLFYQTLINNYPQTEYAEKARTRLEQIKNKPEKPSLFPFPKWRSS
ncbi:MAG: hypothetical protein LBK06_06300 [Planctomycetaceae bacterium]|jgi:tetratricopeptide (TPR) repeat protein|nr:hypothetical protein [Planctomycetaceae bacterium]